MLCQCLGIQEIAVLIGNEVIVVMLLRVERCLQRVFTRLQIGPTGSPSWT